MNRIKEMYKWAGGTDYRHLCYECIHCIKVNRGSSSVDKCRAYGMEGIETDWNRGYIACRGINGPLPKEPIHKMENSSKDCEGQMTIEDFFEIQERENGKENV